MNIGTEFENFLAKRLGLKRVAGSGNGWSSKLDVRGRATRWSLKATGDSGFRIDAKMLNEALSATEGIGGTGETPIWAVRVAAGDFVVMRLDDWVSFVKESAEFTVPLTNAEQRRARSKVPQLLRRNNGE